MSDSTQTVEPTMLEAQRDASFKKEVLALFDIATGVFQWVYEGYEGTPSKALTQFNQYKSVFITLPTCRKIYDQYIRVYSNDRGSILNSLHSDAWLINGGFNVNIAEDLDDENTKAKLANANFNISKIYKLAKSWQRSSKLPSRDPRAQYYIRILLHTTRIFRMFNINPVECATLDENIVSIEKKLGIWINPAPPANPGNSVIAKIFRHAQNVLVSAGMNVGDVPTPSDDQINNLLESFMGNKVAQGVISSVIQNIQTDENIKTPTDFAGKIASLIQDVATPETFDAIAGGLNSTVGNMSSE